jgi:hypothetical protein
MYRFRYFVSSRTTISENRPRTASATVPSVEAAGRVRRRSRRVAVLERQ